MKKIILFFLFILFKVVSAAADCDCPNDVQKPQTKYEQSRVVFTGKVMKIERLEDQSNVEFQVFDVYKGNLGKTVLINTVRVGSMAATCGYEFKEGEEYLIYAYGTDTETEKEIYDTEGCTSIKKISCAKEDLQEISHYKTVRDEQLDNTTLADLSLAKELGCCARIPGFDANRCKGDKSLCTVTVGPKIRANSHN